mmetsp:Transcript_11044/g.32008  ORF Transcript_11044/g.32008 Transcript_11044/m.32008 type:complete len:255 (-) Transcript_11044:1183-1947(-)
MFEGSIFFRHRQEIQDLVGRSRNDGLVQNSNMSKNFHDHIQHGSHALFVSLPEYPGRHSIDVFIGIPYHFDELIGVLLDFLFRYGSCTSLVQTPCGCKQRLVFLSKIARSWRGLSAVLKDHRESSLAKISKFISEVIVHLEEHRLVGKVAVATKIGFGHEEEPSLIHAIGFNEVDWVDDIAQRLRDLFSILGPPTMCKNALWKREVCCHQECWPVYGMEAQNILSNNMHSSWPVLRVVRVGIRVGISQRRNVIR